MAMWSSPRSRSTALLALALLAACVASCLGHGKLMEPKGRNQLIQEMNSQLILDW